jgi:mannose-1-phosphate guanylyltransferase/mannose-6-phosphate isomerase
LRYHIAMAVHPVILSGGAGTRLWPVSRAAFPKQLMPLLSERSLLQETVLRLKPDGQFAAPVVACNEEHRFLVGEQLREIGIQPAAILVEPSGRNTAPALAAAALVVAAKDPEAVILMAPSDHYVANPAALRTAVADALPAARAGYLVTFGIPPARPETGYGYIETAEPLNEAPACRRVRRFLEKPDAETAERFASSGRHLWNSGLLLFGARHFLDELKRLEPELLATVERSVRQAKSDLDFLRLDSEAFGAAKSISVDYAVLERTPKTAVVPVEMGWTDVGSWSSLWEIAPKDADGNVILGDALALDVKNSYIRGDSRLVAVLGLENVMVVDTADAVLVIARDRAQDLRKVVERIERDGRTEHLRHRRVLRPWGSYEQVDAGSRFQVKRIVVKPGGRLSLQRHAQRAEHWVVVRGTARVTRDRDMFDLVANQSTYIPLGTAHRLENPGTEPLHLIEVQSGDYLGEDDIVRIDDIYGRT